MNFASFSPNSTVFVPQGFAPAAQRTPGQGWTPANMPIEQYPRIEKSGSFNYYQPKEFFGQQPSPQYGATNNGFSPAAPSNEFEEIQCPHSMRKMQSACMTSDPFQSDEYTSPLTKSTEASSDDGAMSADYDSKFNPFS